MEYPPELIKQIALYLNYDDIPTYCLVVNYWPDKTFWIDKIERDFSVKLSPEEISSEERGGELYIKMAAYAGQPIMGVEKYLRSGKDICQIIWKAAKMGKLTLVDKLLNRVCSVIEKLSKYNLFYEVELFQGICDLVNIIGKYLNKQPIYTISSMIIAEALKEIPKLVSPTASKEFLSAVASLLSGGTLPINIKKLTIRELTILVCLDIIFDNLTYLLIFNDVVQLINQSNDDGQMISIMSWFYAFGDIKNLSFVLQNSPKLLMVSADNIYLTTHMGNINTIPLLLRKIKSLSNFDEFIEIINNIRQIAYENDDERMIKLLTNYTI